MIVHNLISTSWNHQWAFMALQGYAVLVPNYRGSMGFGHKACDCLPGLCGTQVRGLAQRGSL